MTELMALSRLMDKPEKDLTPIEKVILVASAADEDLANAAAEQYEEMNENKEP
jgi:hypothetical protein